jgi:hypothetical protein
LLRHDEAVSAIDPKAAGSDMHDGEYQRRQYSIGAVINTAAAAFAPRQRAFRPTEFTSTTTSEEAAPEPSAHCMRPFSLNHACSRDSDFVHASASHARGLRSLSVDELAHAFRATASIPQSIDRMRIVVRAKR